MIRQRTRVTAGELAYVDMGEGPAVLLLHGYPTSSFLWRDLGPALSIGMRVIVPDLLGYGESEKPAPAGLSLAEHAASIRQLLATLGVERFAAVGHGLGGGIAQRLAFHGGVEALVLIDSVAFDAWPSRDTRDLRATPPPAMPEAAEALVREWLAHAVRKRVFTVDELEAYVRPWRDDPAALPRALQALDGRGLEGSAPTLAALEAPVLVVWGEDDPFLPAALAERLGEALPGSMVALLPGCGHLVMEDAPDTVAGLVHQFLRRQYLREEHRHAHDGPVRVFLQRPSDATLLGAEEED